ncbi:MAG: hypothetical protein R2879_09325 [Saprospiraceae bacterium]
MKRILLALTACVFQSFLFAQQPLENGIWTDISKKQLRQNNTESVKVPTQFRALELNINNLRQALSGAPFRNDYGKINSGTKLSFPMPDGTVRLSASWKHPLCIRTWQPGIPKSNLMLELQKSNLPSLSGLKFHQKDSGP